MAEKLNLTHLKGKPATPEDPAARAFVEAADPNRRPATSPAEPAPASDTRLIVEGYLKNRRDTCRPGMQLYLKNEAADWIDAHAIAGRGGAQIVINFLIQKGIAAIESEYRPGQPVIARED